MCLISDRKKCQEIHFKFEIFSFFYDEHVSHSQPLSPRCCGFYDNYRIGIFNMKYTLSKKQKMQEFKSAFGNRFNYLKGKLKDNVILTSDSLNYCCKYIFTCKTFVIIDCHKDFISRHKSRFALTIPNNSIKGTDCRSLNL